MLGFLPSMRWAIPNNKVNPLRITEKMKIPMFTRIGPFITRNFILLNKFIYKILICTYYVYGLASRIKLLGVSVVFLKRLKPPEVTTSFNFFHLLVHPYQGLLPG